MSVVYTDHSAFCGRVLRARVADGSLPAGRVVERDVREFGAEDIGDAAHVHLFAGIGGFPLGMRWAGWPSDVRTLTGGFPCQDVSNAGKKEGIDGERSRLWSEMWRIAADFRPDYILVENVPGLLHRGFDRVCGDLEGGGYQWRAVMLDGTCVGAPMLGRRLFIVAGLVVSTPRIGFEGIERLRMDREKGQGQHAEGSTHSAWPPRPSCVVDIPPAPDGIPRRVAGRGAKIEAIGNAVMPQLVEMVCRAVMGTAGEEQA